MKRPIYKAPELQSGSRSMLASAIVRGRKRFELWLYYGARGVSWAALEVVRPLLGKRKVTRRLESVSGGLASYYQRAWAAE